MERTVIERQLDGLTPQRNGLTMRFAWTRWARRCLAAGILGWYAPAIGAIDFWQPEAPSPSDLPRKELVVVDQRDGDSCADCVSDGWRDNLQVWLGADA